MILEHQAEPQPSQPVENRPAVPFVERRSLMDVWRVLTKQRYTIITVTVLFVAGQCGMPFGLHQCMKAFRESRSNEANSAMAIY